MKEKQIVIQKTVYESNDGKEFDNEFDAKKHDCVIYYDEHMRDRYRRAKDSGYCLINSNEELEVLQTLSVMGYVQEGFFRHYLSKDIEFPIMVKFRNETMRPTKVVTKDDYEWFKDMAETFTTLCTMYESVIKEERKDD
jgi:hypothetical protein